MKALRWVLVGSVVALSACQDVADPGESLPFQAASVPQQPGDEQSALARAVPAFGGFWFDEAGRPNASLTDMSQANALRARIGMLSAMRGRSADELVLRQANFPYARLEEAFARATHAALPLAGSVFTDLDETRNLVVVGVERAALVNGTRALLAAAGLPRASYDVIVTDPIYQVATLRDEIDPTIGGIQIHFKRYLCTLGVNVYDGTQRSFVTNSHCTAKQGGVQGTVYYQPLSSVDGTVIATEVEDPLYARLPNCPKGKVCRYSDSSRALYATTQGSLTGAIALTAGPNTGGLTIENNLTLTGEGTAVVGQTVNKVGRTTGWTRGQVTATCVNTAVSGSKVVQLCQTMVNNPSATIVGSGDSGSSVWMEGTGGTMLVGLLWGSSSSNTFVFSPWNQVEQELGNLTVVASAK